MKIKKIRKKKFFLSQRRKQKSKKIIFFEKSTIFIKSIYISILFLIFLFENSSFSAKINSYKNIKVCLCVMGKEENLYAKEYVKHYKKLGYNHIFLYDNNEKDGERFEEVLQEEIDSGFVSIIDWRGNRGHRSFWGPQLEIYADCYEKNNKNYDWLSFYDFDEFLEIYPKNIKIQKFLANKRYNHCQNIKINFLMYSDNDQLYYDKKPVQERFTKPANTIANSMIKSMVRGGLERNYWLGAPDSHTSAMNITCCNSLGEIMGYRDNFYKKYNYTYAALKHYYSKSVEEYVHKTKRGEACYRYTAYDNGRKYYKIRNFFYYSNRTEEKVRLFKKLFNIT